MKVRTVSGNAALDMTASDVVSRASFVLILSCTKSALMKVKKSLKMQRKAVA